MSNRASLACGEGTAMAETRKLAAFLRRMWSDSELAGSDEERTLARLRALRSDLIDPTIAVHNGRIVKRTGDGVLIDASAGGARLHRAALEGLLSNATSRTSSRAPARLPASEILLLGVAAEFRCGSY